MSERRTLIQGLKDTPPPIDHNREKDFVFGGKQTTETTKARAAKPSTPKAPLTTRIRADFAAALKRASLERELAGIHPFTVQDILEEAIEPWLRSHNFLP